MLSKNFLVEEIKEVPKLMDLGKELDNVTSLETAATKYLAEGKIFVATSRTDRSKLDLEKLLDEKLVKYMIYVKDNKIVGGPHFSTYQIKEASKEDAKEITSLLLDNKEIELDPMAEKYLNAK